MQLSNDEIRTASVIVTWLASAFGLVWWLSKSYSTLAEVKKEMEELKTAGFLTHTDQLLCRADVDHKLDTNAQAVGRVTATQAAISQDIKDLTEVVTEMDKKVAVIFTKVNEQ